MNNTAYLCLTALLSLAACSDDDGLAIDFKTEQAVVGEQLTASLADGLKQTWTVGDTINLFHLGKSTLVTTEEAGPSTTLPTTLPATLTVDNPITAVFPASVEARCDEKTLITSIPAAQTAGENGYDEKAALSVAQTSADSLQFRALYGGLKLNFQMEGVTLVEIESVDGYALAGNIDVEWDAEGLPTISETTTQQSILTLTPDSPEGFTPGKDYYVTTLPCDLYGGYRLSIYKDGLVAHYFGVHQRVERAAFITPLDLIESELEFDDPDAPLVEEERPALDATTQALLRQYQQDPSDENRDALLEQMGIRYDKVVARKKAKLRELEREAKTNDVVEEMQEIVDEMVENRDLRLEQQFLRLIDPRSDDNPDDAWMVLRGASAPDAYIGYAPVTNAEYAAFDNTHTYAASTEDHPVVNVTVQQAAAYCDWLTTNGDGHLFRLPTDEEWTLAAGHMPKDVTMNAGHVETGLTPVNAYSQTTGACGGIDFWGNCWEWTTTLDTSGNHIIKGGSWDSDRDDCRSEKTDVVRDGSRSYPNVGFRVVRTTS